MGTKRRIIDEVKVDNALMPQSIASTNVTGDYFPMKMHEKALFACTFGQMVAGGQVKLEVFQAINRAAGSAALIAGATATSALLRSSKVSIAFLVFLATQTVTITPYINNVAQTALVFTAHATVTDKTIRQFSIAGTDTADGDEFVKCVNDPTYGVAKDGQLLYFAVNAAGTVTFYPIEDTATIGIASAPDDATDVKAVVGGTLLVEVNKAAINWAGGFGWVAAKVTTTAATVLCGVTLIRLGRFNPVQQSAILPVSV